MRWRRWMIGGAILLMTGGGGAWAWRLYAGPTHSAEFVELQTKMTAMQELPPEKRFEQFRGMREKVEQLPEAEKEEFRKLSRESMHREMDRRLKEYFALPKEERKAFLDKEIDRWRAMETRFAASGFRPGGPGGPGPGANNSAASAPTGAASPPPGPPPGGFNPERNRRAMLDNTTPEFRAQMSEFMRDMRERRKERGFPDMRGPFGR